MPQTISSLKKDLKRRTFHFTLLSAFSVLAILIVLSSAILFSGVYIDNIYRQLEETSLRNLNGHRDEFDRIFMQSSEINQYLRQNPDLSAFLFSKEPDLLAINRARLSFSQVQYINPYIHSIQFFNRQFPYDLSDLKTGKPGLDMTELVNKSLARPDLQTDLNLAFSTLIGTVGGKPASGISPQRTLSVLFGDGIGDRIGDEAVIINLDADEINRKLLGRIDGLAIITDRSGTVLFSSPGFSPGESVAGDAWFKRIGQSDALAGSLRTTLDGQDQVVTYTHGLSGDYLLANISPAGGYNGIILEKLLYIGFISIGVILVYMALGIFLSRKLSSPVHHMTELIERFGFGELGRQPGELAFITDVFQQVAQQKRELEAVNADQAVQLKYEYLRNLLTMSVLPESLLKDVSRHPFEIRFENLIVISVMMDRYRRYEPDKQYILDNALAKIVPEVLKPFFHCETVLLRPGELAILLNFRNREKNGISMLTEALDRLRDMVRDTFHTTLSIGVGGAANTPGECKAAYDKAADVVAARLTLGLDRTLTPLLVEENASTNIQYPVEMEQALTNAIRLGKPALFEEHVESLLLLLAGYPHRNVPPIFLQIVSTCIRTFNETLSPDRGRYALGFDGFTPVVEGMETLRDAKTWLMETFYSFQRLQEDHALLKNNKHFGLIEKMKEHIRTNYQDVNLSTESIADKAGYAPYYFSKLFRELVGININDFIRQVRLEKAKELLANTSLKAQEIAEMTGFANISNFYLVFKKDVGLTPAVYREYSTGKTGGGEKPG